MKGFFDGLSLKESSSRVPTLPLCGACGLHKDCTSPKMPVTGEGRRGILVVAEAPEQQEERQLRRQLSQVGINLDKDCWQTNAIICSTPGNRTPTDKEIDYCLPNLLNTIKELNPKIIILLGSIPTRALLRHIWKTDVGAIGRWTGFRIPSQSLNAWVCPMHHPSYLKRMQSPLLDNEFKRHLKGSVQTSQRPYPKGVPDYEMQVKVIMDTTKAAKMIDERSDWEGYAAFDYETNMLKPEGEKAEIVSCSICWGGRYTIAYPWAGEAVNATRRFIRSAIPKIASNMKFEERWSRKILKTPVRNWHWDTMLAAHVIDNRPGITSIKFQSFVMLGMPSYDDHIKPYLSSSESMKENRVKEIDPQQLLLYNGLDSLLEYKVGMKQMEFMDASV